MGSGDDPWLLNDPWSGSTKYPSPAEKVPVDTTTCTPPPSDSEDDVPPSAPPAPAHKPPRAFPPASSGGPSCSGPVSAEEREAAERAERIKEGSNKVSAPKPVKKYPPPHTASDSVPKDVTEPRPARTQGVVYEVPANGFIAAKGPGLGEQVPKKRWTFHVQVFKQQPDDHLGIRVELVDGVGFESAARVHRIIQGGLIWKWNEMAVACGMPDWQIEIDDIIVGVNGQMDFHPHQYEVRNATEWDLLVVRDLLDEAPSH